MASADRSAYSHRPVDPRVSFPDLEERVLERWRERDVFAESVRRRRDCPEWGFYEGPPTANGPPGIHHVLSRVFKDIFPRYRTMSRLLRRAQGRLGLPRPARRARARGRARLHLQGRHRALRDRRVQRPLPREGPQPRRGLEPPDRADRLLDRPRRRLSHARSRLRRVGVVGAQDDPRQGPALREAQGGPVLPARPGDPLQPRARAARRLPRRRRPLGLRAPPGQGPRAPATTRRRAADLDDHALDARVQRGGGRRSRAHLRAGEGRRRPRLRARRGADRARAGRGRDVVDRFPGATLEGVALRAAVRLHPRRRLRAEGPHRPARRLRHRERGHRASSTPRSPSARTTSASASSTA